MNLGVSMTTVLLIEDNNDICSLLSELFELNGYHCVAVSNIASARETIRKFEQQKITLDAVVSDCNVPLDHSARDFSIAPRALSSELKQLAINGTRMIITSSSKELRLTTSDELKRLGISNVSVDKNGERIISVLAHTKAA